MSDSHSGKSISEVAKETIQIPYSHSGKAWLGLRFRFGWWRSWRAAVLAAPQAGEECGSPRPGNAQVTFLWSLPHVHVCVSLNAVFPLEVVIF